MKRKLIIFGISFIVGWEAMGAIKKIAEWYKEHKKTKEMMKQLEDETDKVVEAEAVLEVERKIDEMKRQIEEQKKNDVFARELKSKINAANRITEMYNQ